MHTHQNEQGDQGRGSSRTQWVLAGFLAVAAYFLITEHQAHLSGVLSYLPFLLLLACPLMHLFHHGKHGDHAEHGSHRNHGDAVEGNRSKEEPK